MAQRLDLTQGKLTGEPVTLADGVTVDGRFNHTAVSVSASGSIAYRTGAASQRQLTWFDRSGAERGSIGSADANGLETPRLSPDDRHVAVGRAVQGNQDLWIVDRDRSSRFTFDAASDRFPIWSPDGARLVFTSSRTGQYDLYQKVTSGAGAEERLVASEQTKIPTSWSPDGRFLLYHSIDPRTNADLWIVPVTGDRTARVFLKTAFREAWGAFSPDGRFVAYQSNESGRPEIYVRAFTPASAAATDAIPGEGSQAGGQWQVSTAGGVFPVWRADGKELHFLDLSGVMMAAPIKGVAGALEPGAPVPLFQARIVGGDAGNQVDRQYDEARDGRFLINAELEGAAAPITLVMNWSPEARK